MRTIRKTRITMIMTTMMVKKKMATKMTTMTMTMMTMTTTQYRQAIEIYKNRAYVVYF